MTTVSFYVPAAAREHIETILDRTEAILGKHFDRTSVDMDLCATHANGCPLDFQRLAQADDFNLIHDVCGIARHLNRTTGRLGDHFLPRFRQREIA